MTDIWRAPPWTHLPSNDLLKEANLVSQQENTLAMTSRMMRPVFQTTIPSPLPHRMLWSRVWMQAKLPTTMTYPLLLGVWSRHCGKHWETSSNTIGHSWKAVMVSLIIVPNTLILHHFSGLQQPTTSQSIPTRFCNFSATFSL